MLPLKCVGLIAGVSFTCVVLLMAKGKLTNDCFKKVKRLGPTEGVVFIEQWMDFFHFFKTISL